MTQAMFFQLGQFKLLDFRIHLLIPQSLGIGAEFYVRLSQHGLLQTNPDENYYDHEDLDLHYLRFRVQSISEA